jgi:hypothetical protein
VSTTVSQSVKLPPGGLGTALEEVPGEAALGQAIEILAFPAEGVDAGAEGHGAVDAAPGDDDIRAVASRARARGKAPR